MARHKHADLIIAWANGARIEFQSIADGGWYTDANPAWYESVAYRIKTTPKLYQARVEIPRPLTVEEAMGVEYIHVPSFKRAKPTYETLSHPDNKKIYAELNQAYRTPEEAVQRAEAMLKVEEE